MGGKVCTLHIIIFISKLSGLKKYVKVNRFYSQFWLNPLDPDVSFYNYSLRVKLPDPRIYDIAAFFWFWFCFLTEETLLSQRAPNKEALPNPTDQQLPFLILKPQTCQLTNQL